MRLYGHLLPPQVPRWHQPMRHVCQIARLRCSAADTCAGVAADIIIYVTTRDPAACGDTLASAAACAFDAVTHRPIAGNIIFCKYSADTFDKDLSTAVHELFHVLVRSAVGGGDTV